MLLDIPDIAGHEKETLFIIGNGFDRAHELKTSYSEFRKWLMNDHQDFVEMIESIFYGTDKARFSDEERREGILWTDFEAALGNINAGTAREFLVSKYGNVDTDRNALTQAVSKIHSAVDDVNNLILEWSRSIPIHSAHRLYNMTSASKYLTFNYTLTLEECYDIAPAQILHIHGKVSDESVVVGCERDTNRQIDSRNQGTRRYSKQINAEMERFNKPVDDLIDNNNNFFQSLAGIMRVVVIGHSLTDIDIPYIRLVKENINPQANWHFSAFTENDHENITNFIMEELNGLSGGYTDEHHHYIFNMRMIIGADPNKTPGPKAQQPPQPKVIRVSKPKATKPSHIIIRKPKK